MASILGLRVTELLIHSADLILMDLLITVIMDHLIHSVDLLLPMPAESVDQECSEAQAK